MEAWNYKASFVTLTYNDENLPVNGSLEPHDLTNYWKSLRFDLEDYGRKIKYYSCGEYGDQFGRPHYHAIIFGVDPLNMLDREIVSRNWKHCDPEIFRFKRKSDGTMLRGNAIDIVNRKDIQYVCKYIQKKWTGKKAQSEYYDNGLIPPFSRMSKGLGLATATKYQEFMSENSFCWLDGKKVPIPRYYREKFGIQKAFDEDSSQKLAKKFFDNHHHWRTEAEYNKIYDECREKFGDNFFEKTNYYNIFERKLYDRLAYLDFQDSVQRENSFINFRNMR